MMLPAFGYTAVSISSMFSRGKRFVCASPEDRGMHALLRAEITSCRCRS